MENINLLAKNKYCVFTRVDLIQLVREMESALFIDDIIDFNSLKRFSYKNRGRYNPFGYDKKCEDIVDKSVYQRNRLRQKLIRINKELIFVKRYRELFVQLTYREKEIIQLLVQGFNNPKIAEHLSISRYTVEEHRKHINQKLNIKSISNLFQYAYAFDLI